jgi:hypothetical protein
MKHQKHSHLSVAGLSILSSVALISVFSSCSTSGGKQEPLIEHHATDETVQGSVTQVNDRAKSAFKDLGIETIATKTSESGQQQELTGKTGDKTVTVDMSSVGKEVTQIHVVAREGGFQWNEDYASKVLAKITEKG